MSFEKKIKQVFKEYKIVVGNKKSKNIIGLKTYFKTVTQLEKDILKILEDYNITPYVLTLCDKCNKEFQIEFAETVPEWVAVFARCPHCNHTNSRWLRIPKKKNTKKEKPT